MEKSPEYLKALNAAADKAHREYLFGGIGVVSDSKEDIKKALKDIQGRRQELEAEIGLPAINRKVKALKTQARYMKKQANAMSRYLPRSRHPTPDWMNMTPEEIKAAEEKIRHEAEMRSNPHAREITANLRRKHGSASALSCPCCGSGDLGNKMNGKPVCMMNAKHKAEGVDGPVLLLSPEKAKEWTPPPAKPKPKSFTFNEPDGVMKWRKSQG